MALAWITPDVEASVEVAFDTVATSAESTKRPWVLFVGVDDGHDNIASVHYLAGRDRDAIEAFETARTLAPKRSPRQDLMRAVTRLAAGDVDGALRDYRDAFGRAEAAMKGELRRMAEWDLKELTRRSRITPGARKAVALVRSVD